MKLILGVDDVAYTEDGKSTTTGEVAEILEDNYAVMWLFYQLYEKKIADVIAKELSGLLEDSVKLNKPINFAGAIELGDVDRLFKKYLDKDEYAQFSGHKTGAALAGVNHRKKKPYAKANVERPNFIDTGLYQDSFRSELRPNG